MLILRRAYNRLVMFSTLNSDQSYILTDGKKWGSEWRCIIDTTLVRESIRVANFYDINLYVIWR